MSERRPASVAFPALVPPGPAHWAAGVESIPEERRGELVADAERRVVLAARLVKPMLLDDDHADGLIATSEANPYPSGREAIFWKRWARYFVRKSREAEGYK